MSPFFITGGMLARILLLVLSDFTKMDVYKIGGAILLGLAAAGRAESWDALPLGFIFVIAFLYKDKILPKITEGTLLLHGLVGLYIWNHTRGTLNELSEFSIAVGGGLIIFCVAVATLCLTSQRMNFKTQVILFTLFLAINCYIAYQTTIHFLVADTSPFGQVLVGFYGLIFASSILYILYFIPIPGKHQSFRERMANIKQHAADLAEAYHDIDTDHYRTLGIIGMTATIPLCTYLGFDWVTVCATVLTLGGLLTTPKAPSAFTPQSIAKNI